jgi:hypothetical protein
VRVQVGYVCASVEQSYPREYHTTRTHTYHAAHPHPNYICLLLCHCSGDGDYSIAEAQQIADAINQAGAMGGDST